MLTVVALGLVGCGGSSGNAVDKPTASTSSTTSTTAAATTVSTLVPVIATRTWKSPLNDREDVFSFQLQGLFRRGPFVELNGVLTCVSGGRSGCAMSAAFGGTLSGNRTMSKVKLIDAGALKEYQVVTDSKDRPYASALDDRLEEGQSVPVFANFAAPPETTTGVSVVLQYTGGPTFQNVPIT